MELKDVKKLGVSKEAMQHILDCIEDMGLREKRLLAEIRERAIQIEEVRHNMDAVAGVVSYWQVEELQPAEAQDD